MFINLCMSEPFYIEKEFFLLGVILSHLTLLQKPVNLKLLNLI